MGTRNCDYYNHHSVSSNEEESIVVQSVNIPPVLVLKNLTEPATDLCIEIVCFVLFCFEDRITWSDCQS